MIRGSLYYNLATGLVALVIFSLWLVWFTGWMAIPTDMGMLNNVTCAFITMVGLTCMVGGLFVRKMADLGGTVCTALGLWGTVVGFMIVLDAGGVEAVKESGMMTAIATTVVGITFFVPLVIENWLLEKAEE